MIVSWLGCSFIFHGHRSGCDRLDYELYQHEHGTQPAILFCSVQVEVDFIDPTSSGFLLAMSLWHRDAFGRGYSVNVDDAAREHYINPGDGRLAKLLVQRMESEADGEDGNGDDDSIDDKENSKWVSIGPPREHISPVLRLVYWAYSSVLVEGSETRRWTTWSTIELALKWIPCCLLLVLMVGCVH